MPYHHSGSYNTEAAVELEVYYTEHLSERRWEMGLCPVSSEVHTSFWSSMCYTAVYVRHVQQRTYVLLILVQQYEVVRAGGETFCLRNLAPLVFES